MFLMQTDKEIIDRITFYNTVVLPKNMEVYINQFYNLPDILNLSIEMRENTVLPDVFLKPYPMVSGMIMQVMRMYRVELSFRKVVINVRNSKEYKQYFLLYVDEKTVSLFRDFELKRSLKEGVECIISLDFAESILRRNARGIELIEEKGEDVE